MSVLRSTPQCLWHNHDRSWIETTPREAIVNAFSHPEMLVVESIASQVSIGTERLVLTEKLPEKARERMRIPYMQGTFEQSFTYGYSLVGRVLSGPSSWTGERVHLLHPHQRYAVVKTSDATIIPKAMDTDTATLISNMETAVTALWDAKPGIGDRVTVFGYGLIGTLICHLLRSIRGLELTVIEPDPQRAQSAQTVGLRVNNHADHGADLAISTAANATALQAAIECVRREGTILELSWHGNHQVPLCLGDSYQLAGQSHTFALHSLGFSTSKAASDAIAHTIRFSTTR